MAEKIQIGINLQIRNLENRILQALAEFPEVPIEAKRVVVQGILENIIGKADKQTAMEMEEYEKQLKQPSVSDNEN